MLLLILMLGCARAVTPPPEPALPGEGNAPTRFSSPTPAPQATATPLPAATKTEPVTPTIPPTPADQAGSGVEGRVTIGSTCGNQPVGGESDCLDRPYQAKIVITDPAGQIVAQGNSDTEGFFRFALPPGRYRLVPESAAFLSVSPAEFTVESGTFTYVPVLYHTHIQ